MELKYVCGSIVKVLDAILGEDTASRWLVEKAKDVMSIPNYKCWEYEKKNWEKLKFFSTLY